MTTKKPATLPLVAQAICTLAEIKAAVEAFDRGETNVLHALDGIAVAVEEYRHVSSDKPRRSRPPRKAA